MWHYTDPLKTLNYGVYRYQEVMIVIEILVQVSLFCTGKNTACHYHQENIIQEDATNGPKIFQ